MADSARKEYLKQPWISPKVEVRDSPVHGLGLFAKERIEAGEAVAIWGGDFVTEAEAQKAKQEGKVIQQIGEDLWDVFDYETRHDDPTYNHNHSCDPNTWMQDEVTIGARRSIEPDEELTIDYAMFVIDDSWVMPVACGCGTTRCRHNITGQDWKLKELQERYAGHFSPLLLKQISQSE